MRKIATQIKGVALLLFFICLAALGQSQTVTGTVKDPDKKVPIFNAIIKVIGTTLVTQTNANGVFTIKATAGQTLTISSIGFETQKIVIKAGESILVNLKSQSVDLEDVTVTVAMDIKRNPKELGYSAQKIAGEDIKESQRENFVNSLQGLVAGATITQTSGVPGASSTIIIRGFNSMSLNNQPLFIVDGIIMDNSTVDAVSSIAGAAGQNNTNNDFTNRIGDINPNDIESITVLKGPEATVLYGSSASNGAIVITTKKAKITADRKFRVNYDNSFRIQSLQNIPTMYNGFLPGSNGVQSISSFSSFGPAVSPTSILYDNVGNFFRTASGQTHNLAVDFGSQKSGYRLSTSYYNQAGVVPNTKLTRYNFKLTNTTKIGKYVDITPSITYTRSDNDKALKGAGGYLLNLFLWPTTDDARNYLLANGHKRYLLGSNQILNNDAIDAPLGTTSETDNPFFAVNRNVSKDKSDNYAATLAININPFKWLTVAGRFGYTYNYLNGFQYRDPESASQSSFANKGQLDNYFVKQANYNHTITATAKKTVGKFNLRFTLGTRWNSNERRQYGISGTQDSIRSFDSSSTGIATRSRLSRATLVGPSEWNLYNSKQIAGFGEATISYNNVIFLTGSLAFESSSILPKASRNYSYPGASLSIIISDIFPKLKGDLLNYWKLRGSLASTARLPDPYANQSNFIPTITSANVPVPVQYAFTNANPFLKPERQQTYEVGTEAKLFNNVISIDAAYYNTLNLDQIAQGFRASYGTGFVLNTANNSSVRNQGIEISLGVQAIKSKDFEWNIQFNFNHMWNRVLAIPPSIDVAGADYYDASTWLYNNARGGLRKGYTTGTITSFGYKRQDLQPAGPNGLSVNNGAILISPTTGLPVNDGTFRVHADRSVWLTLGTINRFRYKTWSLSFLWDLRVGGDIFNGTNMYLTNLGKSVKTADRLTPRAVVGYLQNGLENTATPTINTIIVTPYNNSAYYGSSAMPEEDYMERDIKAFRLRDISISYGMSPLTLRRYLPAFKSLSFFLTCNDLLLYSNYSGADPSANGGNASLRGVGAVGFDFGNIAAPLSFNGGFRIGF
ncbi:MAG: SusC/RagA family TonB-linked outer membrane protein [Deinococcales bacterium]|nr:SusC/RagA family TonB-linked outer membrane protein [Chitinophagaceae bacterium]